jgi:Na+-translocating ferredoxin:NAD+ oxidoreductase RnfD subunit
MKILWVIVSIVPAAFLFHYYEYGQYVKREEASFLLIGSLLYVLVAGFLSHSVKLRTVFLLNGLSVLLSMILASSFLMDDGGWFKPVGRDGAVLFAAVIYLVGQLFVRAIAKQMMRDQS